MAAGEFELIDRIRARCASRADVLLGIGDDAALLAAPGPSEALVVCVDTLNVGVHFLPDCPPSALGHKALAVNLSDLAAMGARPRWATLSLSLPSPDAEFVDGFIDGLLALADEHDVSLVGGDTTRGPLSVCVQAIGLVEPARALRRDAAKVGDAVYMSGCTGDAAAGLALLQQRLSCDDETANAALIERLQRPRPRIAIGRELAGVARAAIDFSDGLLADLGHVLKASGGLGAVIDLDALPVSDALQTLLPEAQERWPLQLGGGDDYELLVCGDAAAIEATLAFGRGELTRIGSLRAESGIGFERGGKAFDYAPSGLGFCHFASG